MQSLSSMFLQMHVILLHNLIKINWNDILKKTIAVFEKIGNIKMED